MAKDPFASAAAAQAENEEELEEVIQTQTDSWDGSISATFKGNGGYDSTWYVVRAPNWERMAELLEDKNAVARAVQAGSQVDKYLKDVEPKKSSGGVGSGNNKAQSNGGNPQKGKPRQAEEHPDGKTEHCEHGEMTYRTGVKKSGQGTWSAFFCPDEEKSCKPIDGKTGKPWS